MVAPPSYDVLAVTAIVLWTLLVFFVGVAMGQTRAGLDDLPTKQDVERLRSALSGLLDTIRKIK